MMPATLSSGRKRVVVFISGSGSNMVSLVKACQTADFPAEIACVISDKATAGGLEKARGFGIPTLVFERRTYASKTEHEGAILAALGEIAPDIICLAGYMRLISGISLPLRRPHHQYPPFPAAAFPRFAYASACHRQRHEDFRLHGAFRHRRHGRGPDDCAGAVPVLSDDTADTWLRAFSPSSTSSIHWR